jgi:hypothetical protein
VSGLGKHRSGEHGDKESGKVECRHCGLALLTLETLRRHLRRQHRAEEKEVKMQLTTG